MADVLDFYHLKSQPFSTGASQPFLSGDLKTVMQCIKYSATETGICVICGVPGQGVSYAVNYSVNHGNLPDMTIKYFPVCHISPRDVYKEICRITESHPEAKGRMAMITAIRTRAGQLAEQRKPLLLILDNAQNIPEEVLQDLPSLISTDYGCQNNISVILCGDKGMLPAVHGFERLRQRITAHHTMNGLTPKETKAYVLHRLKCAGGTEEMIHPEVLDALHELSAHGNCRELNNLMRDALRIGMNAQRTVIDMDVIVSSRAHQM